jgi:glutathione S-transferase
MPSRYSPIDTAYSWIARLVLAEKDVDHTYVEVNPFATDLPPDYLARNPFRRVPTLMHDDFVLVETAAITRYLDEALEVDPGNWTGG